MTLYKASVEQLEIINNIKTDNIIVDAIAGAGKTTTILHISKKYKDKKILLITYNSKLRHETLTRAQELELNNIDIHTYHSFCYQFDKKCSNDFGIDNLLNNNKYELNIIYDYIIIDEAQDMTPLYYSVVHSIFSKYTINQKNKMNICILGDKRQSVYAFNNADSRFITMYDQLYNINNKQWKKCNLTTTYRLNKNMVEFVNKAILKSQSLKHSITNTNAEKVDYYLTKIYESEFIYNKIIKNCIIKYGISNVLIIAPSVRDRTPFKKLINYISLSTKYPTYIPTNDNCIVDKRVLNDKLVFLTFHQAKGLERECVIVYNIDDSYNKYYDRDNKDYDTCPNTIYVALTRAKQKLIILHDYMQPFMQFIDIRELKRTSNIKFMFNIYKNKKNLEYEYKENINELPQENMNEIQQDINELQSDNINELQQENTKQLKNEIKNKHKILLDSINSLELKACIIKRLEELDTNKSVRNLDTNKYNKQYTVSEFIRHLPSDIINAINNNYINKVQINKPEYKINIKSCIAIWYYGKILYEDVANINGIYIPFYYEYNILNKQNNTNIIRHLKSLYCIKKYETKNDIIEQLIAYDIYYKLSESLSLKDNDYINYFYFNESTKDKITDIQIYLISYKRSEPKRFVRLINNNLEVCYFEQNQRNILKNLGKVKKGSKNKSYKIFLSYFDYLFYKGNFYNNDNKLDFIDLRNKIFNKELLNNVELLKIATIYNAYQDKILNKLVQLNKCKYEWFSEDNLQLCIDRINGELNDKKNIRFEKSFMATFNEFDDLTIGGEIDCITDNSIYEFKFTNELLIEHIIQLLLYMAIYNDKKKIYYLYNIKTNEKLELMYDNDNLLKIIKIIYNNKKNSKIYSNDDEFKNNCDTIIKNLYNKKN